ncbi:MAG: enoyl-CoA hydratase/isomerase family protein [Blastomonas fulva]|uniref:enoyl-CoA hydratase/isomerase family protein n=1 Tax=Blastomonas fulva TaxID=1550728 RepID=UPI0024E217A1|nr:enoyl-CoA hydratase/isomerase family protein [Blastomonas fulva]MDK2756037.1 enoyl-CoA hydratase/isomerase family protein [Blastomonas fulva]
MSPIDHIDADDYSPLGVYPAVIVDAARYVPSAAPAQSVVIGVDREGKLPMVEESQFDVLLTSKPDAPAPWVEIASTTVRDAANALAATVAQCPMASTILCQTLRINEQLSTMDAIIAESLAYSALLGGSEFARWNRLQPRPTERPKPDPVLVEREGDLITLTLNDAAGGNAMTAAMRDALYAALANIADDPTAPTVTLQAAGKCFSTGGALHEFGTADDLAAAHAVRTLHSCARIIAALGDRVTVRVHGACVGSGMEIPAAASYRIASSGAWFQLPELRMGLIPGAGGTVTVSRAIGRHRCCWMVLSGKRVSSATALEWGLVHQIENRA